jgi:O-antigen/teichoic acid export membrane protein
MSHVEAGGRTRRYFAGVLTGAAVVGLNVAVGLWLTPYTLRFLDADEYALFVFGTDLLTWLVVLDLGLTAGLRAQAAQLSGRPDAGELSRLASTTLFAQLPLSLLFLLAGAVLAAYAPAALDLRPGLRGEAALVFLLLGLGAALNFATQTFSSLLVAHQELHADNAVRVAQLLARTAVTVLLLHAGWKVLSLAVAALAANALFGLLAVARCRLTMPGLAVGRRLASSARAWGDLKSLNVWYAVGAGAGAASESAGRVAAGVLSLGTVTTLALTGRAYALALLLLTPLTAAAQPGVGQLIGGGQRDAAFDAYRRLLLLSTGAAMVVGLSFWSGNAAFVTRWVGAEYYGGGALDLLLLLRLWTAAWVLPHRMALVASLRARPQALARLAEAAAGLLLAFALAPRFGLAGVVCGSVAAALLTSCWLLPRHAAEYFGRGLAETLRQTAAPLALPFAALLPVACCARLLVPRGGGYTVALAAMAGVAACGCALLWRFTFDDVMRARAAEALRAPAASSGARA